MSHEIVTNFPEKEDRKWSGRRARLAAGIGTVLVLASLALIAGRVHASHGNVEVRGEIHIGDLHVGGSVGQLVEVPRGGVHLDLWSNPESNSRVRPGQKAKLFFETNADCYVTLVSVDTRGRARVLFPGEYDDGWAEGGRTYRLPARRDHYDLRFSGPAGIERVYALASLDPIRDYYPEWMAFGSAPDWGEYAGGSLVGSGWLVGDPIHEFRGLTRYLVPSVRDHKSYSAAWISFEVGKQRRPHRACAGCGGLVPVGHRTSCSSGPFVSVAWGPARGWIDFRVDYVPSYHVRWCRTWKPRYWAPVGCEPTGRWRAPAGGHWKNGRWYRDAPSWEPPRAKKATSRHRVEAKKPSHEVRDSSPRTGPWGRSHAGATAPEPNRRDPAPKERARDEVNRKQRSVKHKELRGSKAEAAPGREVGKRRAERKEPDRDPKSRTSTSKSKNQRKSSR